MKVSVLLAFVFLPLSFHGSPARAQMAVQVDCFSTPVVVGGNDALDTILPPVDPFADVLVQQSLARTGCLVQLRSGEVGRGAANRVRAENAFYALLEDWVETHSDATLQSIRRRSRELIFEIADDPALWNGECRGQMIPEYVNGRLVGFNCDE